jgi:hypothetical protein
MEEWERFTRSGELLDITITSLNNPYGKDKAWHSMQYGIQLPLTKYKHELQDIDEQTKDDKSSKRVLRLEFLKLCEEDDILEGFFQLLLCWLNGGGDKKGPYTPGEYSFSQYDFQKIILTVSGGNIITIFAKLLQNIVWAVWKKAAVTEEEDMAAALADVERREMARYGAPHSPPHSPPSRRSRDGIGPEATSPDGKELYKYLTTTNREILTELENIKELDKYQILEYIKNKLISGSGEPTKLLQIIKQLLDINSEMPYSDFDYGLLPNKDPDKKDLTTSAYMSYIDSVWKNIKLLLEQNTETGDPQGFTLFRVKSSVLCKQKIDAGQKQSLDMQKKNCDDARDAGVISQELIDKLIPQLINKEDKDIPGLQASEWTLCKQFIQHLLNKKRIITTSTQFNVKTVAQYFAEHLRLQNLAQGKYLGINDWQLEGIVFYINYNTYHLNEVIKRWENGCLKIAGIGIKDKLYEDVVRSFLSLNTIIDSNYLLSISGTIIAHFLNFPDWYTNPANQSFTEKLLDTILKDMKSKYPAEDPSLQPSKITLVNSTRIEEFGAKLKKDLKQPLQDLRFSEVGFPDGINIVLNVISPNISYPQNTTLDELFEGLKIYTVEGPDDLRKKGGKSKRKTKKYKVNNLKKKNKIRN